MKEEREREGEKDESYANTEADAISPSMTEQLCELASLWPNIVESKDRYRANGPSKVPERCTNPISTEVARQSHFGRPLLRRAGVLCSCGKEGRRYCL